MIFLRYWASDRNGLFMADFALRKDDGERVGKISDEDGGTAYKWSCKPAAGTAKPQRRRPPLDSAVCVPTSERVSRARSGETLEQCVLRSLDQYFSDLDGSRPHALMDMVTTAVERPVLAIRYEPV